MNRTVKFTILGQLSSMKNRRTPSKRNPFVTHKNPGCRSFERDFMQQVPRSAMLAMGAVNRPLKVTATVFYRDFRSDVDMECCCDLLQKAGVVRNDRYIRIALGVCWAG